MYETACARALENLGCVVFRCDTSPESRTLLSRFEFKYTFPGPNLRRLQAKILDHVSRASPDVVLIWLGASILPETLRAIKKLGPSILVGYVHDDPFAHRVQNLAPSHHRWYWRYFIEGLPSYDMLYFSKIKNVDEALRLGARNAAVLRQYFVPELHRPVQLTRTEASEFDCDAAFAGHFEPDGREECIRALALAGLHVRIYGDESWKDMSGEVLPPTLLLKRRVSGEQYVRALTGAKLCLCFLSKMNRDRYTTRCFEIPACGRLLLSERTDELQQVFKEDEEAVFFSGRNELVAKARWLIDNPSVRNRIAEAGMRRVHAGGHSVNDRMMDFLAEVARLRSERNATVAVDHPV